MRLITSTSTQHPTPQKTRTGNGTSAALTRSSLWSRNPSFPLSSSSIPVLQSQSTFDSRFIAYLLTDRRDATRHGTQRRVAAPSGPEDASVPSAHVQQLSLSDAIGTINTARKAYSASALPPTPPTPFKRWVPERAPDAPHDPNAYFPMILVK